MKKEIPKRFKRKQIVLGKKKQYQEKEIVQGKK